MALMDDRPVPGIRCYPRETVPAWARGVEEDPPERFQDPVKPQRYGDSWWRDWRDGIVQAMGALGGTRMEVED